MSSRPRLQYRLPYLQMSSPTDIMSEHLWFSTTADYDLSKFDAEHEQPMSGKTLTRQASLDNLCVRPYTEGMLHDRYMSSEEESSPSPEPDRDSTHDEEDDDDVHEESEFEEEEIPVVKTAIPVKPIKQVVEPLDLETEIAVAVPIMAMGRPRLVDITNLAPMHKRKRSAEKPSLIRMAVKSAAAAAVRIPVGAKPVKATPSFIAEEADTEEETNDENTVPESWLPSNDEEDEDIAESQGQEHYFPELELRTPLTYNDYDPYSLNPPKLSPRTGSVSSDYFPLSSAASSTTSNTPFRRPGSIARARKNANAANNMLRRTNARIGSQDSASTSNEAGSSNSNTSTSWRGSLVGRTLSNTTKRYDSLRPREAKKAKMQARGATERENAMKIPPFSPSRTTEEESLQQA